VLQRRFHVTPVDSALGGVEADKALRQPLRGRAFDDRLGGRQAFHDVGQIRPSRVVREARAGVLG
jgi:hypothetical protein